MSIKSIAIAADHAGFELKEKLKKKLVEWDIPYIDLGAHDIQSVDYPDYAKAVAKALQKDEAACGILICGSGIGISIAANRFPHVRAALIHDVTGARLSRQHNDANVICLGARLIGENVASDCVKVFLETAFEGGRHQDRLDKIAKLGSGNE